MTFELRPDPKKPSIPQVADLHPEVLRLVGGPIAS